MSSTDVLIYVDVISNKQSIFSSQIRTPSFSINWPSLVSTARSPIILWRLWSHKPSHKHDSNKYQSKAFVICDHKSDETRSVTHENKAYLVWLMFRMLSNQHYPHRANQKLRSWANAVFQNRGVCGQAFPSFPSPSPVIPFFFALVPTFLDELARKRLLRRLRKPRYVAVPDRGLGTGTNYSYLVWLMFRVLNNQHYQHRTNQKLRSWSNAVIQNHGVCGQVFPSFPSPSLVIPLFCSRPNFSRRTRAEALAT